VVRVRLWYKVLVAEYNEEEGSVKRGQVIHRRGRKICGILKREV
jgi:hypothetical protein